MRFNRLGLQSFELTYASIIIYLSLLLSGICPVNLERLHLQSQTTSVPVVRFANVPVPLFLIWEGEVGTTLSLQQAIPDPVASRPTHLPFGRVPMKERAKRSYPLTISTTVQRGITNSLWCRSSTNWIG